MWGHQRVEILFIIIILFTLSCNRRADYVKKLYFTMGTTLEITLPYDMVQYSDSLFHIFQIYDSLLHPTRKSSDVLKINSNAGCWVKVSPLTADCIQKSLALSDMTGGEFDITVGKMVHLWHFEREGEYCIPSENNIRSFRKFVNYRLVKVKGDSVYIGAGQNITLSGIAKGCALDYALRYLIRKRITSCIVNAGGDMLVLGDKGKRKWTVGIQSPWKKGHFKLLAVSNKFVATSGNYVRYIKEKDTLFTHIFNPFTGEPLEYKKLSVTVVADSGYIADGLATAFSVMGREKAIHIADSLGVGFIAIYDSDTVFNKKARAFLAKQR